MERRCWVELVRRGRVAERELFRFDGILAAIGVGPHLPARGVASVGLALEGGTARALPARVPPADRRATLHGAIGRPA
jgi:hypothetical protein